MEHVQTHRQSFTYVRLVSQKNLPPFTLQAERSLSSLCLQLFLGAYPDEHFIEKPVKAAMEKFRKRLAEISSSIKRRNEGKKLPYYSMSPDKIPNSVAV